MTTMNTGSQGGTMRAAVYRRFGGPDVVRIEQVPKPSPGTGEVLVKVHATTVSAADYRSRTKDVPKGVKLLSSLTLGFVRPRLRILGMDIAGVVEAVGPGVSAFRPGDEVMAMLGGRFGGHAEYVTVSQDSAITRKPANLSFEDAATVVFGGITARAFLDQATLTASASVLVNGASGAVGSAAVQLAHLAGAHVTAVTSGGNAGLVRSLGADRVIDYTTADFTREADRYDIVVDCVGNVEFGRLEPLIKPGGALLSVIADLAGVVQARSRSRRTGKRITAGNVPFTSEQLAQVARLAGAGLFQPVVDRTFDLSDIADAHRYVDTGRKRGNVVIRVATAPVQRTFVESRSSHTTRRPPA
ncbi:NAD(P)-dependent alcohol dehydrogenase [Lysobacter korlensis]|uniref:NAD(P)-dependent alcohol dehydrogenase n=1 Tax=Lysobacter korlensis TaxID=553636 RepID=A0ABV6S0M2_9GAMM